MKIKSLHIKNFKSIVDLTINEPNPFTVFVGPNGSGKSNIFEALEYYLKYGESEDSRKIFGGNDNLMNFNLRSEPRIFDYIDDKGSHNSNSEVNNTRIYEEDYIKKYTEGSEELNLPENIFENLPTNSPIIKKIKELQAFKKQFSRYFFQSKAVNRINYSDDSKLNFNGNNLEKVLKRLLENTEKREEISEWLELFLPEFDRIEVQKAQYSSNEDLLIFQKHYERPFTKAFISDGTYNVIALLTAVYQSDEPQFLCIEEPENGLHPQVIKELVNFFRWACEEERGHYIWLNTHSQTLVDCLTTDEIILVDKVKGETIVQQVKGRKLYDLPASDAWLSGALGGGVVW